MAWGMRYRAAKSHYVIVSPARYPSLVLLDSQSDLR